MRLVSLGLDKEFWKGSESTGPLALMAAYGGHPHFHAAALHLSAEVCTSGSPTFGTPSPRYGTASAADATAPASTADGDSVPDGKRRRMTTKRVAESQKAVAVPDSLKQVEGQPQTRAPPRR